MNLWFRLGRVLLARPWRRPLAIDETFVTTMRVWPFDLDINRHVTNGRYYSMADIARVDFLFRSGAYKVALAKRALPVIGDNWGKFRKELKLFQKFEIHTRLVGWDEKWIFIQHEFKRQGRVLGFVTLRCVFRSGREVLKPQLFIDGLGMPSNSPVLPAWLQQWSACCDDLSADLRALESRD